MEYVVVIVAAAAAFIAGAVWYGIFGKAWMAASGVKLGADGRPVNSSNPLVYITSFLCALLVAGMMRHVFVLGGIDTLGKGFVAGLGIGLFFATPWIVINYAFAGRPRALSAIDGGYATVGCTAIGLVLTLF